MSAQEAMMRDLVQRQEAWLQSTADRLGLTVEQLAERYELEHHPRGMIANIDGSFEIREEIRLVPRPATPPQEVNTRLPGRNGVGDDTRPVMNEGNSDE